MAGAHETDEVLDLIVNEAARLLGTATVYIRLLQGDSLVLGATATPVVGFEPPLDFKVGEGASVPGHVMATKKPVFGDDAARLLVPETLRVMEENGIDPAAVGAVPLLANGQSIGTISVGDLVHYRRRFTDDDISLLTAFADQAAMAIEKARLLKNAERE